MVGKATLVMKKSACGMNAPAIKMNTPSGGRPPARAVARDDGAPAATAGSRSRMPVIGPLPSSRSRRRDGHQLVSQLDDGPAKPAASNACLVADHTWKV